MANSQRSRSRGSAAGLLDYAEHKPIVAVANLEKEKKREMDAASTQALCGF
ncbi:hypothetical protein [Sphingopyxis sp. BSNA05]|uniref:hypothetical protein n=1 Tax=Sphingopyxis sp. BSNA05 TaxID=1236614 RepID=UPI0020B67FAF|nr:hypothetical protein [Sphingopyxis sp. BSNA05]